MLKFLLSRLAQTAVTLLIVSIVVFALSHASGNPLYLLLPPSAGQADFAAVSEQYGLDKPLVQQYFIYMNKLLHFDLGRSIINGQPVKEIITQALPYSLRLAGFALALALAMGIPLGVLGGIKRGTRWDTLAQTTAVLGQAMPSFWLGLMLIIVFAVNLRVLPVAEAGGFRHYILPGFTLGLILSANVMRLLRTSLIEVLDLEFIRMLRVKGVPERTIIWKHAVRNAIVPVVSFAGMYLIILVTNAVVVETVFAWPGFGRLAYTAVLNNDFPLIQGIVLIGATLYIASSLMTDVLYSIVDPRIRLTST
ncbi:MAG: ABC transporter permease [Dehalococcoidia bacterium]|nr:ABC transporter permease [Dehalococcoidia bacterium]